MSEPEQSLKEKIEILAKSQRDFAYFVTHIFSKSIRGFVGGKFVEDACRYITKYDKTMRVAFRSGFKSTLYHAFVLWNIMFRGMNEDLDIRIFSFNERMANEHVQKIRTYIENNPYFDELINYKPLAENVIKCSWDRKHITTVRPVGMVSFHRGMKADILLLDDIYSDPSSAIDPHLILKINDIFRGIILKSIKPGGQIHVTGSTISRSDIFFDPEIRESFHIRWEPAIKKDESGNEVPAWPEMYTLEKLKKEDLKNMGENRFQVEMMLQPFYSTDSFFNKEYLRKKIVNPLLRNFRIFEPLHTNNLVIAGWDLGMKKHPADFQVYEIKNNKAIMIHHKSMKWLYYTGKRYDPFHPSQVEYCLPANTRIEVLNGSKTIKEIQVGDLVKTHKGRFKKVLRVYKRWIRTSVCKLKTKYQTLYLTRNHKILSSKRWKGSYEGGRYWRRAERIKVGDLLHYPQHFKKPKCLYFHRPQKGYAGKRFKRQMLTIDLAWLFGIYTAEGSSPKRRIYFTFGSHELELIEKTKRLLTKYFGQAKEDKSHYWSTNVYINSISLSKTFRRWFGSNAREKHVPEFILKSSERYKASFLKGLIEGDGSVRTVVRFDSASERLRNQFIQLCNDLSISCYSVSDGKNISPQGKEFHIYWCSIRKIDWNKIKTIADDEYKIISNEKVLLKDEGLLEFKHVYNLEVEEDNSYIANGFIVHNCMEAIKSFGIDKIYYDNTRGELEGAAGSGLLTPEFIPVVLTSKYRRAIANEADKIVSNQQIEIFDDEDLLNSICGVTKDLVSIQTSQSHGDAFWALVLAMIGFSQNEVSSKTDKEIRTGSPGIFGFLSKIPKGW